MVAEAGAEAVGLNFYPRSPRFLTEPRAAAIVAALPPSVIKVGLFVNAAADHIARTVAAFGLDVVQLHGDEPPQAASAVPVPVIKAFRLGAAGLAPVDDWLAAAGRLGFCPRMVLLDAFRPGQYGGTGETANWSLAAEYCRDGARPPLLLAGGLTPTNVGTAIAAVRPHGVDTASGVEQSPGVKSPEMVRDFIAAARAGLDG